MLAESDRPAASAPRPPLKAIGLAWLGAVLAISTLALASSETGWAMILGSFGASCTLLFAYPDGPFSQPRNVVLGHLFSSFVGLVLVKTLGPSWWAMGLAVGTAVAVMMATRTVHPPAGSNPVIIFLADPGWTFLIFPTAAGAVALMIGATFYNRLARRQAKPLIGATGT